MTQLHIVNLSLSEIYDRIVSDRHSKYFLYGGDHSIEYFTERFDNHSLVSCIYNNVYAGTMFVKPVNYVIYDVDFWVAKEARKDAIYIAKEVINRFCTIVSTKYSTENNVILRGLTPVLNRHALAFIHNIGFKQKVIHKKACKMWKNAQYCDIVESIYNWGEKWAEAVSR